MFKMLFYFLIDITVTWNTVTTNIDNTPIDDLSYYTVYWGIESGNYLNNKTINAPDTILIIPVNENGKWFISVTATDLSSNESGFSNEVNIILADSTEDPPEDSPVDPPTEDSVSFKAHCFPNPFNNYDGTTITLSTPNLGALSIDIYTATGNFIRNLIQDLIITEKEYSIKWDGKDQYGNLVNPGIYIASLTLNSKTIIVKMAVKP